eukprot:scaffold6323_cov203-Alexandrium_tamarense.AAC.11
MNSTTILYLHDMVRSITTTSGASSRLVPRRCINTTSNFDLVNNTASGIVSKFNMLFSVCM